jgi:hypothetical protein
MKNFGKAKTVDELIKLLSGLPPFYTWFGLDDESLILVDPTTDTEVGYIENGN